MPYISQNYCKWFYTDCMNVISGNSKYCHTSDHFTIERIGRHKKKQSRKATAMCTSRLRLQHINKFLLHVNFTDLQYAKYLR